MVVMICRPATFLLLVSLVLLLLVLVLVHLSVIIHELYLTAGMVTTIQQLQKFRIFLVGLVVLCLPIYTLVLGCI